MLREGLKVQFVFIGFIPSPSCEPDCRALIQ